MNNNNFSSFLKEKGYHPYELSPKDRKFYYLNDPEFISSYGPVFVEWLPEFRGTEVPLNTVDRTKNFIWGLHEKNHPPCLVYPRPFALVEGTITHYYPDFIIDRLFEKYSPKEILKAIKNNLILIV